MSNTPLARCFKCGDNHRTSECPTAELREQGRQSRASTKRADARQSQFIALQSASIEQLNAIREVAAKNADAVRSAGLRTEEQLGQLSEQLEGLGNTFQVALQDATQKVTAALGQLNDAFVRAHIEQMWTEKCQLDVLVGIEDAIRSPRATEATELLHLAINCLNSDMIPRAIRLLDEAVEKNPTDIQIVCDTRPRICRG